MTVGNVLRKNRGKRSQLQESMPYNVSRESWSKYENNNVPLPKDIAKRLVKDYDDPELVFAIIDNYTGGAGPKILNGENACLELCRCHLKTTEELREAEESMIKNKLFAKNPKTLTEMERQEIEETLIQVIDAIQAGFTFLKQACKEYQLSWWKLWRKHADKMVERGYIKC